MSKEYCILLIRDRIFLSAQSVFGCVRLRKKKERRRNKRKCCWCLDRCSRKVAQLLPDSYSVLVCKKNERKIGGVNL